MPKYAQMSTNEADLSKSAKLAMVHVAEVQVEASFDGFAPFARLRPFACFTVISRIFLRF